MSKSNKQCVYQDYQSPVHLSNDSDLDRLQKIKLLEQWVADLREGVVENDGYEKRKVEPVLLAEAERMLEHVRNYKDK